MAVTGILGGLSIPWALSGDIKLIDIDFENPTLNGSQEATEKELQASYKEIGVIVDTFRYPTSFVDL